ncbi:MAG: sugar ABC transporter permease [Lachnospiraceae bacterium]|nr:sugar ABC transporter permease [Lachnospiraceae bacterium]
MSQKIKVKQKRWKEIIRKNWELYLLLLPTLIFFILFHYYPMYGAQIAFRDFKITKGIWGSDWVGFKHFQRFLNSPYFIEILLNTLRLSIYSLIVNTPLPIAFALMLNYCRNRKFAKVLQTVSYAPHFISTVVMVAMLSLFLSTRSGFVNQAIKALGGQEFNFMASPEAFPHLYVWSGVWQNLGWSAIIYIGSLSSISPELHEAAIVDGATIMQRIRYVDIPGIMNTVIMLLILNVGNVLSIGFEKVFLMSNSLNSSTAEVISTYTYKVGMVQAQYSYSTAVGLFNSIVNFILLVTVNTIARKVSDNSVY